MRLIPNSDFPKTQTAFALFVPLMLLLAVSTWMEREMGTAWAWQHVYGTTWFVVAWAVPSLFAFFVLLSKSRKLSRTAWLLHGALLLILAGALVTRFTALRGVVHLRTDFPPTRDYVERPGNRVGTLPFGLLLERFEVTMHPGTDFPADYRSHLLVLHPDGTRSPLTVSMNRIGRVGTWRLLQSSYDPDGQGSLLMVCRDPAGIALSYAGYLLLTLAFVVSLSRREGMMRTAWRRLARSSWTPARHFLLPLAGLLCVAAPYYMLTSRTEPLLPVLRSPFLPAHVSVVMASYVLLALVCLNSLAALILPRWRRDEAPSRTLAELLLPPAVALLSTGIFLGAVWANISWGSYWSWDAKETWALLTLFIYALPLHRSARGTWLRSSVALHLYLATAFLVLLMTYLGVNHLLGGLHSYA